jgi:hypothetical protein
MEQLADNVLSLLGEIVIHSAIWANLETDCLESECKWDRFPNWTSKISELICLDKPIQRINLE